MTRCTPSRRTGDPAGLSVRPDNTAALALYTRCGFGHTAEPGELLPDGSRELVMAKPLGVG